MSLWSAIAELFAARRTADRMEPETKRAPTSPITTAGIYVTPDRALQNPVVWACVRYLSTTVAQLPWRVKRELPGGGYELAPRHPLDAVLWTRPNPEITPFSFKETLIAHALLWGNGYAEIVRDGANRPRELWIIHPERVEVRRDIETDRLYYEVDTYGRGGASIILEPSDMLHIRGFGDGPVGLSVVEHAAQTIGWAQAAELFGAAFFGNGLNFGGFIEVAGGLTEDGKKRLDAVINQRHKGSRNAHKWHFLDAGMKATKVAATPDEAQFVATMQHQVESLCRWFGVPPHKVAHLLRSTFNNVEHQSIEVVVDSITPWVIRMEEEADFKLLGANRGGYCTDLDMSSLLRGDMKAHAEYLKTLREVGAYSVNDILTKLGEPKIGPEGDKRVVQEQYTTLERIGEEPEPPPAPALPPAEEPDPAGLTAAWAALGEPAMEAVDAVR